MPIRGLTDDTRKYTPADGLPMLGRIFKGDKQRPHPNPKKAADGIKIAGRDLDHFRVEFAPTFAHLQPEWMQMYGNHPRSINGVFLLGLTPDEAFPTWYEAWSKTALLSRCDGETQVRHFAGGRYSSTPRPCQCNPDNRTCKPVGRLPIVIRPFSAVAGIGYFLLVTHSIHDIEEINSTISGTMKIHQDKILGIPFVLGRQEKEISMPKEDGSRVMVKKWMIYLHPDPAFTTQTISAIEAGYSAPQLPAGAPQSAVQAATGVDISAGAALMTAGAAALSHSILDDVVEADSMIADEPPTPPQQRNVLRVDCSIKSVTILQGEANKYIKCVTDQGVEAYINTRKPFIDGGWITAQEWTDLGKRTLSPNIPAVIEGDGKQWAVVEVKPKTPDDSIPFE